MSEARWTACQGKALGIIAGVFIAGVASGVVGVRVLGEPIIADADPTPYAVQSQLAVDELERQLELDPEQVRTLRRILDGSIMDEAELLMKVRLVQQRGREQILEQLRPEQRSRFELMFREISSR